MIHSGHALRERWLGYAKRRNDREAGQTPHAASPRGRTLTTRIMPACMW